MEHSVQIIKVNETDELEGVITFIINGKEYEAFYWGEKFSVWENITIFLDHLSYPLKWEDIFGENKNKEIKIVKSSQQPASYYCYGKIISITPIRADFGDLKLDLGDWTNDEKVIGEYIYWVIDRLNIQLGFQKQ